MTEAVFSGRILHDIAHCGMRAAVGVIFIVHGFGKFNPGFAGFLNQLGIPEEMQILIALAEFVPGILILVGVLSRISSSIIAVIMLGAIFFVKGASNLTGQGGYELDLILLASCLVIIVAGPGRLSIAHLIKKIPSPIH